MKIADGTNIEEYEADDNTVNLLYMDEDATKRSQNVMKGPQRSKTFHSRTASLDTDKSGTGSLYAQTRNEAYQKYNIARESPQKRDLPTKKHY